MTSSEKKTIMFSQVSSSLETQGWRGQLGWEKWWWKFSRTGERATGRLLLTNQFHNSFECLSESDWVQKIFFGGQHLSCCFRDLLIQKSLPTNWTFRRTCLSILKTLPLFTPTWPTAPGSPKMKFHLHEVEIMNGCQRKRSKWLIDC